MKIEHYPSPAAERRINDIIRRGLGYRKKDMQAVTRMIEAVRRNGDSAVLEYTRKFDAPQLKPEALKVTDAEMRAARSRVDRRFVRALNRAKDQIEAFHRRQPRTSWFTAPRPGAFLGQMVNPVGAAGIYVPGAKGGQTPLVSSVLMCGLPAKIAGVEKVVMATPPRPDGSINPHLLYAAQKIGIDAVYKMGSAWAIAALAYGTETVPRADIIVGPGNIYVTLAKKILSGTVGTDIIAGPSEILIIADASGEPDFIATDLLSQAEHDPLASAILLTTDPDLAARVSEALKNRIKSLSREEIAQKALAKYGALFVVPDLETAFDLANRIAPEHLELHIEAPFEHIGALRNAGAVFIGPYTPEPVGDYLAGPNHVLPTAGSARYASALSVETFMKKTSLIHYSRAALQREAEDIMTLARIEGLDAHAGAVRVRKKG